jgi:hypothetical protein
MKKVLIVGVIVILFGTVAFAQVSQTLAPDISLSTIPLDPKPGESVKVSVQSYSVDLDQATILWKYNGVIVANGIGVRSVNVTAPASGQLGTVTATISAPGVPQASASIVLRPASIDVLWEAADAYTPPFYKGKALAATGGALKAVAIPSASAPRSVVYRWSENGSALQDQSGYNKSSVIVSPDALAATETLTVSAESGAFVGNGSVSVPPRQPSLIAYLKNEGFTDYTNGFTQSIVAGGTGTTVRFEPYYFSTPTSIASDLSFTTSVDGTVAFGDPINELRFSRPSDNASAAISVGVSTALYTLQNLTKTFTLSFQ